LRALGFAHWNDFLVTSSESIHAQLDAYCRRGHRVVEGWLLPNAIVALRELAEAQRQFGVAGPSCEIGVHHGRLFIVLHLLRTEDERSLAIDLFEQQEQNVDGSGRGSRAALLENLRRHAGGIQGVELLAANSLALTAERIVDLCGGRPRLFSIDGGHTAEATCNDLRLAHDAVCDGGLVILDDYFNPHWPAVSEGACAFFSRDNANLAPVAIGANKFFFAKGETAAATYRRHLLARHSGLKTSTVFGGPVVCMDDQSTLRQRMAAHPSWLAVRNTSVGRGLRLMKRLIVASRQRLADTGRSRKESRHR
jgi:hypothetical protein